MNTLAHIKQTITPILLRHGVQKAGLFGSVARGEQAPGDVDILVRIDKRISLLRFIGIQQELEDALGMNVDLVEYSALKPALKSDILKEEVSVL